MKIICIGRNYVDHAKELNNPLPEKPVFFLKPDSALLRNNKPFFYPDFSRDIHFETELVIKCHKVGKSIHKEFAHTYYNEIALGIDFTARDLQRDCKKKGLPWEISKGFDQSAPLSKFFSIEKLSNRDAINFHLDVNGKTVQQGSSADMVFSFEEIISYVSGFMKIKTGDMIFTGTPSGVGPIKIGDRLEGYIEDKKLLDFLIK